MRSSEAVAAFLKQGSWRIVRTIDLGTTSQILVVEKDGERHALKTARGGGPDVPAVLTEYRVLQYLNRSPVRRYVPRVREWLPELGGFLMAYLRYPTPAEKADAAWVPNLARALHALHSVDLPDIPGLDDDRPNVGQAITERLRELFDLVWRGQGFWAGLPREDVQKLDRVRAYYHVYVPLLPQVEEALTNAPDALTHGDLAGDNVMVAQSGRLVIVDWGSARISAAWADVASLATYSEWSADERRRFYELYLGASSGANEEALRCLETLSHLHRYRSCVQSLLWLRDDGEGLDRIGRAFFERQLTAL